MNRKIAFLDIIFYIGLPLLIWNQGRELIGDYPAMLLSTVPGFIYTLYRFWHERRVNITGIFIITTLLVGTSLDLIAGSAEKMLWYQVYFGFAIAGLHAFFLVIRKPLAIYFAVDFVSLQGFDPAESKILFNQPPIFKWFQRIQLLFVVRGVTLASFKMWLLQKYGIDGYEAMLIYLRVAGWIFGGMIMGLFFYTSIPIQKYLQSHGMLQHNSTNKNSLER
ncbi:VC0807 family protein [Allobacillus halotolerans]|uniref:Intracellular septation protein A n=1 Tax=Allobacillus halotolerans TaxID=570278 RepID=A0ABS6GKU4_9BACI|nr:VC0807 family protein [Allobacillus halotolerans]MBU6079771.1 hypothetical protein [Allobacillus halotolerans]